ncbi:MAG: TadE family protein [Verrucomicrobiia bacterium]
MRGNRRSWTLGRRGQAVVEFALVLPVLLVLLLGIIELSWLAKTYITLANSAREGARTAAVGRATAAVTERTEQAASPLNVTVTLQVSPDDGTSWSSLGNGPGGTSNAAATGQLIRVRVTTTHQQLSGFFPFLNSLTVREEAIMRREPS